MEIPAGTARFMSIHTLRIPIPNPWRGAVSASSSMAYRRFTDSDGRHWRVWDVAPLLDRRLGFRRIHVVKIHFPERRVVPDRRIDMRRSRLYFPPTVTGWLTFESEHSKRRLSPVPPEWAHWSDEALQELCEQAQEIALRAGV